jgi:hypothetical protein
MHPLARPYPSDPSWWQADDGLWYPANLHPSYRPPAPPQPTTGPAAGQQSEPTESFRTRSRRPSVLKIVGIGIAAWTVAGLVWGYVVSQHDEPTTVQYAQVATAGEGCRLWWREMFKISTERLDDTVAKPRILGIASAVQSADPVLASDIRSLTETLTSAQFKEHSQLIVRKCTTDFGWSGPTDAELAELSKVAGK